MTPAPDSRQPAQVAVLIVLALALIGAQAWLAGASPAWSQPSLRAVADVAPLVLNLSTTSLALLLASPLLARLPPDRVALGAVLACGLIMRLVWYGVPGAIDDDYIRYLWDGAVLAAGHDPYAMAPAAVLAAAPEAAHLAAIGKAAGIVLQAVSYPELTTIYPGTAQLAFAVAHVLAPFSLEGLRLVFLAGDFATFSLLVAILRRLGQSPLLAALYWMSPLVVWASHGTGHTEALLPPLLLGAILLAWQGRDTAAAGLLALAAGVKVWPVLLVPLLARHAHARGRPLLVPALVLAGGLALLLGPLALSAATGSRSGLVAYSDHWWVNNGPFSWLSFALYQATDGSPLAQRLLRASLALVVGIAALALARRPPEGLAEIVGAATAIAALTFYLAPAQFPWYALWFLGLAVAASNRPLLLATATLPIYYLQIPLANQGAGALFNYGLAFLHALPVWAWLVVEWRNGRRTRAAALAAQTPAGVKPRPPSPSAS